MNIQIRSMKKDKIKGSTVDIEYIDVAGFIVMGGVNDPNTVMIYIKGWRDKPVNRKNGGN